ncbi:MAG: MobA/MobL family protein [Parvularcula sp.]|jgi:hypothetical protein|nr:MobA/MobL family protein [Parvularcula sp.]
MEKTKLHPASHCPLFVLSRSNGRSSVEAAAYASRSRMTDQRTGLIYNYRSVPGLLGEGLVHWNGSAEELWNAAEASETRINARVARELRPALPAELPLDDQLSLVRGFCLFLKDRYGVAAHWVVHAPTFHEKDVGMRLWKGRDAGRGRKEYLEALNDSDKTNLNFHAHIRWTVREVDRETGTFGKKTRKLDDKGTGSEEVKAIRAEWERRTNAALEKAGKTSRIDLRSYEDMAAAEDAPEGLRAQEHAGPLRTAKFRKAADIFDEPMVAGRNAMVRQENDARWESWFELRRLAREKARLEGESERIARENEQRRRDQVQVDKRKIREAKSPEERATAISEAGAIDAPDADRATDAAMTWAETSDAPPEDPENAFDRIVDLEAGPDLDAAPTPGETLRVRRDLRERQRVKN